MNEQALQALAGELVALHDGAREAPPFSERYPGLDAQAGYAAARALHAERLARGWRPLGRKIGFTNRTIWKRYGVFEPMWGTVYDRTTTFAQGDRASVPLAGLVQPRIEPELCCRLSAAPERTSDPAQLLASIEWIAHSIEIVQCHHPAWKVTIADCAADNGLHGRLVVGTPVPVSDVPDLVRRLPALEVTLRRGDAVVDRGIGANVLDSPLNALAFLIDVLARQSAAPRLEAGEIVTTGTLTDAHAVTAGETWSTSLAGLPLPGLTIEFT